VVGEEQNLEKKVFKNLLESSSVMLKNISYFLIDLKSYGELVDSISIVEHFASFGLIRF
jgi:hypothetical protein